MKKVAFGLMLTLGCTIYNVKGQIITTIAGNGIGDTTGNGGPATAAGLGIGSGTGGFGVDVKGNLFISTYGIELSSSSHPYISQVRKVNSIGIISRFAGSDTSGFSGDNGPAVKALLFEPGFIVFDKKGNAYIADANRRVRKVDTNGIITTFAGNGSASPSGDGGPATSAGLGTMGGGLCVDNIGNLFIESSNQIRKVDTFGIITTFAGTTGGYGGDGGAATSALIHANGQIAMDKHGNLYIADASNNRIRKIDTNGIITTIAGTGVTGYSGNNGPATSAQLHFPSGVFVDSCDNVYIADTWNNVIRVVNGSGMIKVFAGNGFGAGGYGTGGFSGDNGAATAAELNAPGGIVMDKNGNIYIYDSRNVRIRYIHLDSCINTTATPNLSKGEETLNIFPNPGTGAFFIKLSSAIDERADVRVTNMVGQTVSVLTTFTNKETELTLHEPPGVYFISVSTEQGRWVQKVMIE